MGATATQGWPTPEDADLADLPSSIWPAVQDMDQAWPARDGTFTGPSGGTRCAAYRIHATAVGAIAPSGTLSWHAIDFDTSGAQVISGTRSFTQPPGEGDVWWFLGATVPMIPSGTVTKGTLFQLIMTVVDTDPATGSLVTTRIIGEVTETATSIEYPQLGAPVRLYGHATATIDWFSQTVGGNKQPQIGAIAYGWRLGRV